jgi:hypothetical protein
MALNANQIPVYGISPKNSVADLNAASAGTLGADTNGVAAYTASASGSRVYSLVATTTDTAAVNLFVYILDSATVIPLGIVNVPLSSGNLANTLAVDVLDPTVLKGMPIDNTNKRYIELKASAVLKVAVLANMTAAKHCYVSAQGADYQ